MTLRPRRSDHDPSVADADRRVEGGVDGAGEAVRRVDAEAADQPFLVFRHVASDAVAILFRRPDGHLGLIDTES